MSARDLLATARDDLDARVTLRFAFTCEDGSVIEREWTWADMKAGRGPTWHHDGPPDWLAESSRSWPDPQGPISLTGRVVAGREAEARAVVLGEGPC